MLSAILPILLQPFTTLPIPPTGAFAGKTAIVTGGNTGLGLETARHLLTHGACRVIIAVRNPTKGEAARVSLAKTNGVPKDAQVEVWDLNLSSFASVKAFCTKAAALDNIDYLFLNAGVATSTYSTTPDGWEQTLQVNVLSTALIALLLLPKLVAQSRTKESSPDSDFPRIIITSSSLHGVAPFHERKDANCLNLINSQENFEGHADPVEQYMTTKLFDVYVAREIARTIPHAAGKPLVLVTSVDPGLCRSELQREGLPFPMNLLLRFFGLTCEYGSRNLLAAATGGIETQGGYFSRAKMTK